MINKIKNRKILYIILSIVLILVCTLTMAYAVLSVTLNISGSAEVAASNWDIHFENINVTTGSSGSVPTIKDNTTVNFTTTLNMPGDYYIFTVDIVNDGSIDAMIDSIEKKPTLTTEQTKYINYVIEYENNDELNSKQLLESGSYVRLKVKVQYRKDITTSELPTTSTTLNLSFKVIYTQASENGITTITDNGSSALKVVSGDLNTQGSEICIGEECFYLINNDGVTVTMLAKYNLMVGNKVTSYELESSSAEYSSLENPTGIQNMDAKASVLENLEPMLPWYGTINFSSTNYWAENTTPYPKYVYNSNSVLYTYIENYKLYLENKNVNIDNARLISFEELETLKCDSVNRNCSDAPSLIYSTSYWTGSANDSNSLWYVLTNKNYLYFSDIHLIEFILGIRPVIELPLSEF